MKASSENVVNKQKQQQTGIMNNAATFVA